MIKKMNIYEKAVQGQLDAFNAHDIDEFLKWYTEDYKGFDYNTGEVLFQGKKVAYERYSNMFKNEILNCKTLNRMVLGRTIIDHEEISKDESGEKTDVIAIYEVEESGLISIVRFIYGNTRR